jgi:hypothetical protein
VATAIGCLPSAIDDEPVVNIFSLLEYWDDEPPTHVILALRYLGERKKQNKQPVQSEQEFQRNIGELCGMLGRQAQPVSQQARDLVAYAEEMKAKMHSKKQGKKHGQ